MKRAALILVAFSGACASILGLESHDRRHPFEHRSHVLEGIPCTECHGQIAEAGDEGDLHLPTAEKCRSCHEQPHDARECRDCHSEPDVPARLTDAKHHLLFTHRKHVPVLNGNCARCHQGVAEDASTLSPSMASCLACHKHEGTWEARNCATCHRDLPSEDIKPESHVVHDIDFLRTHGGYAASQGDLCRTCHTETDCGRCHGINVAALPQRLSFDRPGLTNFHRAGFRSRHGLEAKADGGLCLSCHTPTTCQSCHTEKNVSSGSSLGNPHPTGWVGAGSSNDHGPAARRDPVTCASCHGGAGEALCVNCHKVGGIGGNIHPPGYTSKLDVNDSVPCRYCHNP